MTSVPPDVELCPWCNEVVMVGTVCPSTVKCPTCGAGELELCSDTRDLPKHHVGRLLPADKYHVERQRIAMSKTTETWYR